MLREDLKPYRDELIVSSKAGWDMWPGPYGQGGGSRKYVLASLDQSLKRLGLDYVDIFYSHRFDPDTPLEETMGALATAVKQGKALYVGISSYSPNKTREGREASSKAWASSPHSPALLQHAEPLGRRRPARRPQGDRHGLHPLLAVGAGPALGKISERHPGECAHQPRRRRILKQAHLSPENIARAKALNEIAKKRGQSLTQMAIAWVLRDPRVTTALIGASSPEQVKENVGALAKLDFSKAELAEIDKHAVESGINLWEKPSTDQRP